MPLPVLNAGETLVMQRPIQLLAVVPNEWLTNLREALAAIEVNLSTAHDWQSAVSLLRTRLEIEVVLTASMLPDATWKELLADILHLPRPPQVVVAARYGDFSLWCDVLENGGYDLISYPFKPRALQHTVISASVEYELKCNMMDGGIAFPVPLWKPKS